LPAATTNRNAWNNSRRSSPTGARLFPDRLEVVFFSDGQALLLRGWNALGPFHIVLLDIMMPGVNGYDIARRIRDLDDEVLLVFLTGSRNTYSAATKFRPSDIFSNPLPAASWPMCWIGRWNGFARPAGTG
jgi:CheY-like chemotaxis protein